MNRNMHQTTAQQIVQHYRSGQMPRREALRLLGALGLTATGLGAIGLGAINARATRGPSPSV